MPRGILALDILKHVFDIEVIYSKVEWLLSALCGIYRADYSYFRFHRDLF